MKIKTGVSLDSELISECDDYCVRNDISRSELIEQALGLYLATRNVKAKSELLVPELAECIAKASDDGIVKISKGLFRYAVEVEMLIELLADSLDIDDEDLYEIRRRAVNNVRRTRGKIKLDDLIMRNAREGIEDEE
ncbi:hypothetical protein SAMN02910317_01391 [Ruminococcaceae bacterium FB2012]|nr:hypothetical protein SAMN02910317_01391 [Ruminococcaceae bacterium FB2012]